MLDALNREIKAGDVVAYPGRKRSRAWLQIMRVDQVLPDRLGGYLASGRHAQVWGAGTLRHVAIIRRGGDLQAAADRQRSLAAAH